AAVALPYLELALLLEDAHDDRVGRRHRPASHIGNKRGGNRLRRLFADVERRRDAAREQGGGEREEQNATKLHGNESDTMRGRDQTVRRPGGTPAAAHTGPAW